ncbi:MAG: hypothetical protein AB7S71_03945 [Dongiaceae bacterium]
MESRSCATDGAGWKIDPLTVTVERSCAGVAAGCGFGESSLSGAGTGFGSEAASGMAGDAAGAVNCGTVSGMMAAVMDSAVRVESARSLGATGIDAALPSLAGSNSIFFGARRAPSPEPSVSTAELSTDSSPSSRFFILRDAALSLLRRFLPDLGGTSDFWVGGSTGVIGSIFSSRLISALLLKNVQSESDTRRKGGVVGANAS